MLFLTQLVTFVDIRRVLYLLLDSTAQGEIPYHTGWKKGIQTQSSWTT